MSSPYEKFLPCVDPARFFDNVKKMENLDAMSGPDLLQFWSRFYRPARKRRDAERAAEELFEFGAPVFVQTTRSCANFAINRFAAMSCREGGDYESARVYDAICADIYYQLPKFARW